MHVHTFQAHCNTLQHPATPCNTLQHPATPCHTRQRNAPDSCRTCDYIYIYMYIYIYIYSIVCVGIRLPNISLSSFIYIYMYIYLFSTHVHICTVLCACPYQTPGRIPHFLNDTLQHNATHRNTLQHNVPDSQTQTSLPLLYRARLALPPPPSIFTRPTTYCCALSLPSSRTLALVEEVVLCDMTHRVSRMCDMPRSYDYSYLCCSICLREIVLRAHVM